MNLNSAGALLLCLLAAPYGSSAPVRVGEPSPPTQLTGHVAILKMMVPANYNRKFSPKRNTRDLREQLYREVMASEVAYTDTPADHREFDRHSSAVFRSLSIPAPDTILKPARADDREQKDNKPADAVDITSTEFMLKNLAKSIVSEIKLATSQNGGQVDAAQITATKAVLAVTNDELVDRKKMRQLKQTNNLAAKDDVASLESSILYVLLCKIGLLPPAKIGLNDECG